MPRKAYLADLEKVSACALFGNISRIQPGEDQGELTFDYRFNQTGTNIRLSAFIPEISDYPHEHDYLVFAGDDAPAAVTKAIQNAPDLSGLELSQFFLTLSKFIGSQTATGTRDAPYELDDDGDVTMNEEEEEMESDGLLDHSDSDYEGDNEDWALQEDEFTEQYHGVDITPSQALEQNSSAVTPLKKAREDLKAAKLAGFKVGVLGNLTPGRSCYISIGRQVSKLGISEEAMSAWELEPSQYLILLMWFPHGYRSLQSLEKVSSSHTRTLVQMRIGVSHGYKPRSMQEAASIFRPEDAAPVAKPAPGEKAKEAPSFVQTFISKSLDGLLNERFLTIVRYRLSYQLSWTGAELTYQNNLGLGRGRRSAGDIEPCQNYEDEAATPAKYASIVAADHIQTCKCKADLSLPLIAMQFVLRHFVGCTGFCLVCHQQLETSVEAIKPYVCDNPLCLFQYMSLGFGPSIEHDILNQPYVVDLLISFCYTSAAARNLHAFPEGLSMLVPNETVPLSGWEAARAYDFSSLCLPKRSQETDVPITGIQYPAQYEASKSQITFTNDALKGKIRSGDWIAINLQSEMSYSIHCHVTDANLFPNVKVLRPKALNSQPYFHSNSNLSDPVEETKELSLPKGWISVLIHVYDRNFDELNTEYKYQSILLLLDLLPPVFKMRTYLLGKSNLSLSNWQDRIPPAALSLLRWIIASNRSCIMQVDQNEDSSKDGARTRRHEDRVQGMPKWLQFRFAMGTPDKERRFIDSIQQNTADQEYPTIFAWHGSPLSNWNSIIRVGLHFNRRIHGRVYGDGVYFSRDFGVSAGYGSRDSHGCWPRSCLQVTQAISLNEIVNKPTAFVSRNPHYVVKQLDWIQTRYLFVHSKDLPEFQDMPLTDSLKQDPHHTPSGQLGAPIEIPITAVSKSRRPKSRLDQTPSPVSLDTSYKRVKVSLPNHLDYRKRINGASSPLGQDDNLTHKIATTDDDIESVITLQEDRDVLEDETEEESKESLPSETSGKKAPTEPVTPFEMKPIPDLPLMPVPSYATSQATKRLQRDIKALLSTQDEHIAKDALHELGWYLSPTHVFDTGNLYQWIVELHSFPSNLPLAQDLQKAGQQSVILEIRFHATYPMSPPFVRVVRPRFLPFMHGGGGHVTAGGSICMDLLTNTGWTAVSSIEAVLLQIRMAIMSTDPRPARLEGQIGGHEVAKVRDYSVPEAVDAFKRACRAHGWVVPEGLNEVAFTSASASSGL